MESITLDGKNAVEVFGDGALGDELCAGQLVERGRVEDNEQDAPFVSVVQGGE